MRYLIILLLLCNTAFAAKIPQPPIIKDKDTYNYLRTLYDYNDILETTETAPNGNRKGRKGQVIMYNDSGTFKLFVNTDGDTTWQQI